MFLIKVLLIKCVNMALRSGRKVTGKLTQNIFGVVDLKIIKISQTNLHLLRNSVSIIAANGSFYSANNFDVGGSMIKTLIFYAQLL